MVVDHAHRLQTGVHDGATDELEPRRSTPLADAVRELGARGHVLHAAPVPLQRLVAGKTHRQASKLPNSFCTARKARALLRIAVTRDLRGIGTVERPAVVPALVEHRAPPQTGLGTLEHQELEQPAVVMAGAAPLVVVRGLRQRVGARPRRRDEERCARGMSSRTSFDRRVQATYQPRRACGAIRAVLAGGRGRISGIPFDRMLISQAIAHGLAIVTPDPSIAQYPVRVIW